PHQLRRRPALTGRAEPREERSDGRGSSIVGSMLEPAPETAPAVREPLEGIRSNIALAERPLDAGAVAVLGCVCGSEPARRVWQRRLEEARPRFGARTVLALHEDLPVNQAFGVLLAWARVEPELAPGEGALLSFVFGE